LWKKYPWRCGNLQRDNFPSSIISLQSCLLEHTSEFHSYLNFCLLHSSQQTLNSNVPLSYKETKLDSPMLMVFVGQILYYIHVIFVPNQSVIHTVPGVEHSDFQNPCWNSLSWHKGHMWVLCNLQGF
jgi:hypothetical protein